LQGHMAKVTKTIPVLSTNREPKTSRVRASAAALQNEERQPDPLLIYMGKVVVNRRRELGLTQLQLSKKAGCNSTAIFMVEGAKHNMTIRSMMLLAAALGLQVSDFFPRSTPRNAARMAEVSEILTDMAGRLAIQVRSLERLAAEIKDDAKQ
jgi:transcriptional regulator with XRE-family HTH domain